MGNKARSSSFELLRVLSMLMVIAFHWELHAKNDSVFSSEIGANQIFSFAVGSWGTLGVNLFFMISAFFLIKKNNIKITRVISMVIKVSIYGTIVLLVANLMNVTPFDVKSLISLILGVFAYQYWFITVYCIIYVLSPALNKLINILPKYYLNIIICILVYISYVLSFVSYANGLVGRLSCGITIYFIIGFLEKRTSNNFFEKYRIVGSIIMYLGILLLEISVSYIGTYFNPSFYPVIRRLQTTESPVMLVMALFIFYIFKNLKINYNRIINFIGKYSSGAYLLHGGGELLKGLCVGWFV